MSFGIFEIEIQIFHTMTDRDHDYLNMFRMVSDYFTEHAAALTAIVPAFAAQKTEYDTRFASFEQAMYAIDTTAMGAATNKKQRRKQLHALLPFVSSALIQYLTHVAPDAEMAARIKRSRYDITRQNDAQLTLNSRLVWETADAVKTLLSPYGVSAAQVDEMGTAVQNFEDLRTAPRDASDTTKRDRAKMHMLMQELRIYLRQVMDLLLGVLEYSNSLLHYKYQQARKLHKARGKRSEKSPDRVIIAPGSTKELVLRKTPTTAEDGLMCISHSKHAEGELIFYYSTTPAGEQTVEGLTIAAGTRQATTAGAIGYSEERKHLCVRNTAMQRHNAGVARGW